VIIKNLKFLFHLLRYLKADKAALHPSPAATTICFSGTLVTSPAANNPGTFVSHLQFTIISPYSFLLTKSTISEFGTEPISIKTP
jgi:hypothetical protein